MDSIDQLPDSPISGNGLISKQFERLCIDCFHDACRYVHRIPYGYNSDRENLLILFKEGMGSCTTKHAVIATLAEELQLPVVKNIGIYAMTEEIVTGTDLILSEFGLPYLPMVHCFLASGKTRVDLTEGNRNGKNRPIDNFLFTQMVEAHISGKDEYLAYRSVLKDQILSIPKFKGISIKRVLQAREKGLVLLKERLLY